MSVAIRDDDYVAEEAEEESGTSTGTHATIFMWVAILALNICMISTYGAPNGKSVQLNSTELSMSGGFDATKYAIWKTEYKAGYLIEARDLTVNEGKRCVAGGWLSPVGEPMKDPSLRGAIYFFVLCWVFMGVAIISDVFMEAIEVITSQEREIPGADGATVTFKVWNDTVANLTLMALGSSAPEILLAVVETCTGLGSSEKAVMGASTIVGSAAFNLLLIISICISCLDDDETKPGHLETRKIDELYVYACTAIFSILAYAWMVVVLMDFQVEIWEGVVTLLLFPLLVGIAYALDAKKCPCMQNKVGSEDPEAAHGKLVGYTDASGKQLSKKEMTKLKAEMEIKKVKDENPDRNDDEIAQDPEVIKRIAEAIGADLGAEKWSLARRKMAAVKMISGSKRMEKGTTAHESARHQMSPVSADAAGGGSDASVKVGFSSPTYAVREDEGTVNLHVFRTGDLSKTCSVSFATADGTATAGEDYMPTQGEINFAAGESKQVIPVEIIDDDEEEDDEVFTVTLSNAQGCIVDPKVKVCVITIIDNDKSGTLSFKEATFCRGIDSPAYVEVEIIRQHGCDGVVTCDVSVRDEPDNRATFGKHFTEFKETVTFAHQETMKPVRVPLLAPDTWKSDDVDELNFLVHLDNPTGGKCKIGKKKRCAVLLSNDQVAKMIANIQDRIEENKERYEVGTHSWHQRFIDAISAAGEEEEDGDDAPPGPGDIVAHVLSLPWKVAFAFCPPTDYCGGYLTFVVSLIFIGGVTAIVEQVAKMMGCTMGLPDEVTSITIVALGTSLPDTFASMSAAKDDDNADASVGNVTGSNSVNVFLGLGLPWTIASIHSALTTGGSYPVQAGGLNFMVAVFSTMACICIVFLAIRRVVFKAELGGHKIGAYFSSVFLACLWIGFVVAVIAYTMPAGSQ